MVTLYTINQWKNELRHFGIKIGSAWYFSMEEILYLKKKDIIMHHPLLTSRAYISTRNSRVFQKGFTVYCQLKENGYNLINNHLYYHTKNFNRKHESCIGTVQFVRKNKDFELMSRVFVIVSDDEYYILNTQFCVLDKKLTKKLIKGVNTAHEQTVII